MIQLVLLTTRYLAGWPSLGWTLVPVLTVDMTMCIFLTLLFIGLFRISVNGVTHKRYMTGTASVGTFSLLAFLLHVIEKYEWGKDHSLLVLCVEFLIPEVGFRLLNPATGLLVCSGHSLSGTYTEA